MADDFTFSITTTRFNEYSGAWTDFILADLQGYLLRIVQERAEAQ